MNRVARALCLFAVMGCSSNSKLANTLVLMSASDTYLGTSGQLRLAVGDRTAGDTAVTITSDNPAVVAALKVKIAGGQTTVDATYTPRAVGHATLTATLGSSVITKTVSVVDHPALVGLTAESSSPPGSASVTILLSAVESGGAAFLAGASRSILVSTDINLPANTNVVLASSDPSILSVPAQVTVPAFADSVDFSALPKSAGTATLTATMGNSQISAAFQVFADNTLTLSSQSVVSVGAPETLSIELGYATDTDTTVTLTSSNPAVLAVPATAVIPAGNTVVFPSLTVLQAGLTTLTASAGDNVATTSVTSVSAPAISQVFVVENGVFALTMATPLTIGVPAGLEIEMNSTMATPQRIAVSSSDSTVVSVPATAVMPASTSAVQIPVTAVAAGAATVTLGIGNAQTTITVSVVGGDVALTGLTGPGTGIVGTTAVLSMDFNHAFATPQAVQLSSSDASVVSVPDQIVIAPGALQPDLGFFLATLPGALTLNQTGTAYVTATVGASHATVAVQVTAQPQISFLSLIGDFQTGAAISGELILTASGAAPVVVNVTSSDPTLLVAAPAALTIPAGQTFLGFTLEGLVPAMPLGAAETVSVTFSLASDPTSSALGQVHLHDDCPLLAIGPGPQSVAVGHVAPLTVQLACAPRADVTITLNDQSSCNPATLIFPETVVVPVGQSGTSVIVTGVQAGTCTIADAGTSGVSGTVDVTP